MQIEGFELCGNAKAGVFADLLAARWAEELQKGADGLVDEFGLIDISVILYWNANDSVDPNWAPLKHNNENLNNDMRHLSTLLRHPSTQARARRKQAKRSSRAS